ncbi:hypothetical protein BD413DRAFT_472319 [Trametes elegans]|nr:hypothetical protein BD413DRAFT_472319 [Trametes elegans]
MNPLRRSTVHDLATLRLHRDGSRVLNSDTNLSSRRAKHAVRDARGNWLAHDAGGLGNVKQRRSASQPDRGDVSEPEDDADEPPHSPSKNKGKGRARGDDESGNEHDLNPRARKRRRFDEDLGFLVPGSSPALPPAADNEDAARHGSEQLPGALPIPSSDLLKCIHYFASTYYTAMGQLTDTARDYRKERKARRLEKAKETRPGRDPPHSSDEEIELSEDEVDELMDDDHDAPSTANTGQKAPRKKGPRQLRPMEKDMYKIFDGSALMALGMLFQGHVAEMLEPRVPEEWEKEMALVERTEKADAKRVSNAKRMRKARHPIKEDDAVQEHVPGSDGERRSGDGTEDEDGIASDEQEAAGPSVSSLNAG